MKTPNFLKFPTLIKHYNSQGYFTTRLLPSSCTLTRQEFLPDMPSKLENNYFPSFPSTHIPCDSLANLLEGRKLRLSNISAHMKIFWRVRRSRERKLCTLRKVLYVTNPITCRVWMRFGAVGLLKSTLAIKCCLFQIFSNAWLHSGCFLPCFKIC